MGEAARRLAETDFDRERMARRLEILLASLIGPSAWRAQLRPDRETARGRT
jgi:hypothetical protein